MKNTPIRIASLERTLRAIRQHIFDMPDEKQTRATRAISKIKARLSATWQPSEAKHWMYAAE